MSYWRRQLAGLQRLEMPTDYARPAVARHRGAVVAWEASRELGERLKALSRHEAVTEFITLMAGYAVLLSRYSGQSEVVVGTDVANREQVETEELIGFFVNQLVMRMSVSGEASFKEVLKGVKEVALGAYVHQDLPFEKLVEELEPERDLARSPLFQVAIVLQNTPQQELRLNDLHITRMQSGHHTSKCDLTLLLNETNNGLQGVVEYDTDLFEAQTIRRLLRHYERVLTWVCDNPNASLNTLTLTSDSERAELLAMASGDVRPVAPSCVHDLIGTLAEQLPDAPALISGDVTLTFADLNTRANQLARHLRKMGVATETPVALCLERGVLMMAGLLAILKSGGAYVPLDPSCPAERLSTILDDIQSPVVLTDSRLQNLFAGQHTKVLRLDKDWEPIAAESVEAIESAAVPESLAYVIYTSGSTGKPKGVAVTHEGLWNYLAWCLQAYDPAAGQGAPVHSSISFDLTVTSLFAPLLAGKPVVLLEESADALARAAEQGPDFSLVKLTPAHLNLLSNMIPPENAGRFTRQLIIGGEALSEKSLTFWRRYAPKTRLINEYGPTETVVGCCVFDATLSVATDGSVPIGRPLHNIEAHVFDAQAHLAPIGVWGELCIGGPCLARGYINNPAITAESFMPHPFSQVPGNRLYRTGDRTRWRGDGNLEFQGRTDDMVKLRGYRVELGEIEILLGAHAEVRECAVVMQEEAPDDRRLVAFYVPADVRVLAGELRAHLESKLPDYSVPSQFIAIESLPLTSNGKVDRAALSRLRLLAPYEPVEEMTPEEAILAGIWADVLNCHVGLRDSFFRLGGHSLLATKVMVRVRDTFGVELPLRTIFEGPTVAEMARAIALAQPEPEARLLTLELSLPNAKNESLLERLPELSEEEIDSLLQKHAWTGMD